jgi:formate hydrogenlyase subunit 6/NADH:ubiquinone oxidoreductase subunit I
MASYLLPRDKLNSFLAALDRFQVWAPVIREGCCAFEPVSGRLDSVEIGLQHQPQPAKKAVFPQTEPFFSFGREGVPQEADLNAVPETVIFGIRPCDARSFALLDPVFEGAFPDPYYLTRRGRAIMLGIACTKPFANCFCTSIGGDPFATAGLDLRFTEIDDGFLIDVITGRGQQIIDAIDASLLRPAAEKELQENERRGQNARGLISRHSDISSVPQKLAVLFDHPLWKQFADACIGCGICTYTCPTCYCFDMQDEAAAQQGRRVRTWDSCMFSEYTLHASGHNPRPTRASRFRNRIYHKFKFNQDNYGALSCVGCGRCTSLCPVNIDLLECLAAVKDTA